MVNAMEIDSQYETTENACVTTMRSQQHSSPAPPSEELRQTGRNTAVALVNAVSLLDNICGSLTTMYQRGGLGRARFHRSARDLEDCPPVRGEWASGASANSRCGNICDFCDPRLVLACVLEDGVPGSGDIRGSECGNVHTFQPSQEAEKLTRADDDKEKNDSRKRNEESRSEDRRQMAIIAAKELIKKAKPQPQAGLEAALAGANQRLAQCLVWFQFLSSGNPGVLTLSPAEQQTARVAVRAACKQWAVEGAVGDTVTGSPIFWTIGIALEMVAQREGGYAVPTVAMQKAISLDGIHAYLGTFKSQAVVTDESVFSETRGKGKGASEAVRATQKVVRRLARFDPLGAKPSARVAAAAGRGRHA